MDFKEELERLEANKEFNERKKDNSHLAHGFVMLKGDVKSEWQIGYYDKESDRVTTFLMGEEIKKSEPTEIFKKEGSVRELDPSKISIGFEEALEKAKKRAKEKFGEDKYSEAIILVQNIEAGQVWNISFLKGTIILNFKIDTHTGDIIDEKKTSLVSPRAE